MLCALMVLTHIRTMTCGVPRSGKLIGEGKPKRKIYLEQAELCKLCSRIGEGSTYVGIRDAPEILI